MCTDRSASALLDVGGRYRDFDDKFIQNPANAQVQTETIARW
jgi:hypothetical protein